MVERYVAAVAAGDAQTVRELFAPTATWTLAGGDLPIAGTWEGRDAIIDEFLATAQSYYVPGSITHRGHRHRRRGRPGRHAVDEPRTDAWRPVL